MNKTIAKPLATFPWAPGVREILLPAAGYEDLRWAVHARRDFANDVHKDMDWDNPKEVDLYDLHMRYYDFERESKRAARFLDLADERPFFTLTHAQVDRLFPSIENRWNQMIAIQKADPLIYFCQYEVDANQFCVFYKRLAQFEFLKTLAESDPEFWQETVFGDEGFHRLRAIPWKPGVEDLELQIYRLKTLVFISDKCYADDDLSKMKGPKLRAHKRQHLMIKQRILELKQLPVDPTMAAEIKRLESVGI